MLPDVPGTGLLCAIESLPSLHCQNDHAGKLGVSLASGGDVVPVPLYHAIQNGCCAATVAVKLVFALDLLTYKIGRTPSASYTVSENNCAQFETNSFFKLAVKFGMYACSISDTGGR